MHIVFVGPKTNQNIISGGHKRYVEAMRCFHSSSPTSISSFFSLMRYVFNRENVYISFDERYLFKLLFFLLTKRKVFFFPRGNKIIHYQNSYGQLRLGIYKYFFSFLYSKCHVLVFQTKAQYKEFKDMYDFEGNFKILPNNINTSWMLSFAKNSKHDKFSIVDTNFLKIGFLGGINERKGFMFAYNSLKDLIYKNEVEFHVAGDDFKKFINFNVKAYGQIFDDALLDFYKNCDIIIIPSRYDSFPNVLLESLAMGCIPIITHTKITEEILGKDSLLLFERNVEGVQQIISNFRNRRRYLVKAQRECFSLEKKYTFDWCKKMRNIVLSEIIK